MKKKITFSAHRYCIQYSILCDLAAHQEEFDGTPVEKHCAKKFSFDILELKKNLWRYANR
jgi:hypothetical protein